MHFCRAEPIAIVLKGLLRTKFGAYMTKRIFSGKILRAIYEKIGYFFVDCAQKKFRKKSVSECQMPPSLARPAHS